MAVGFLFGYGAIAVIVLGSLLASHTLLGASIVDEAGANGLEPIAVTFGATVISDTLSLIVFAVCVSTYASGFSMSVLGVQLLEIAIFVPLILFGLSRIGAEAVAPSPPAEAPSPSAASGDWPSYNKTLTSERYSELDQINTQNVGKLKVLCTYDVDQYAAFESGLVMVDNALIGTTQFDIFSLNPATCAENWRTHEDYPPAFCPPIEAPPTWTACCFAAPRTGGSWAMTSRPASEFGKR